MALNPNTVWQVRATGSAANSGGFNPARGGTDYTTQDAAQPSLIDLACANSTTLTSITSGFTAPMAGNLVQVAPGTNWTAGFRAAPATDRFIIL